MMMINVLRKVIKRWHYPLEVTLVVDPQGTALSAAQQFHSLAFCAGLSGMPGRATWLLLRQNSR
jgi:hypothetical protein